MVHPHIIDPRGHFSSAPLPISPDDLPLLCKEKPISTIKPSLIYGQEKAMQLSIEQHAER